MDSDQMEKGKGDIPLKEKKVRLGALNTPR